MTKRNSSSHSEKSTEILRENQKVCNGWLCCREFVAVLLRKSAGSTLHDRFVESLKSSANDRTCILQARAGYETRRDSGDRIESIAPSVRVTSRTKVEFFEGRKFTTKYICGEVIASLHSRVSNIPCKNIACNALPGTNVDLVRTMSVVEAAVVSPVFNQALKFLSNSEFTRMLRTGSTAPEDLRSAFRSQFELQFISVSSTSATRRGIRTAESSSSLHHGDFAIATGDGVMPPIPRPPSPLDRPTIHPACPAERSPLAR